MAELAFVLSSDDWNMTAEDSGEKLSGTSVWYVTDYRDASEGSLGLKPTKISCTPEIKAQLATTSLPALFELDYGSRPGAQGKATLTLIRAKFVKAIDLFNLAAPKSASV